MSVASAIRAMREAGMTIEQIEVAFAAVEAVRVTPQNNAPVISDAKRAGNRAGYCAATATTAACTADSACFFRRG